MAEIPGVWQDRSENSGFSGDGGREDFEAVKLDADGGREDFEAVKLDADGGREDFEAVKLDADGGREDFEAVKLDADGGREDFEAVKLDADGAVLRKWQEDARGNSGGGGSRVVAEGLTSENFGKEDSLTVRRELRGGGVTPETVKRRLSSSSNITVAVVCVVVLAVLFGVLAFVYFRRKRKSREDRRDGFEDDAQPPIEKDKDMSDVRPTPRRHSAGITEPFSPGLSTVQDIGDIEQDESRSRRKPSLTGVYGLSLAEVLLDAAKEIADHSSIPIVGEAASLVSILVRLFVDSMENPAGLEVKLKRCRSIVLMLRNAAKVLDMGSETSTEAERILVEDVFDAVEDLVEIIKTFESKNRLGQIISSSLFKRRVEKAEALIDSTIVRLQMNLSVHIGHKVSDVGYKLEGVREDVRESLSLHRQAIVGPSENPAEVANAGRLMRRQQNLAQIEIPEDDVEISRDFLGKGGFGAVYIADYGGRNAAAKVIQVEHCIWQVDKEKIKETHSSQAAVEHARKQRKAFLRELEAMMHLRSPHTVNVYGAITSRKDRLVLVMELMVGGDLRAFLESAEGPIPKEKAWLIMKDVSAGVAFLHSKQTVHGDLKSANVLFDGQGRAKIGDFGTCRWTQNSTITGLATYTTKGGQNTQMSFAWAAPEVLNAEKPCYASDVYSLAVVLWEILTRELPWGTKSRPRHIISRVLQGDRPNIPGDCPAVLDNILKVCWIGDPDKRPSAAEVKQRVRMLD